MASDGQAVSALPDGGVPPAQPVPGEVGIYNETLTASNPGGGHLDTITTTPMETDHDSDVEIASSSSEDSVDTTADAEQTCAGMDTRAPSSRKRKSLDRSLEPDERLWRKEKQKKVKLDLDLAAQHTNQHVQSRVMDNSLGRDKSTLPPEIWHHIFTFCPPKSLGNLLCVNKLFNQYLDPSSSVRSWTPVSGTKNGLNPLKPNAIWQASRRLYWPQMPTPLRSKTELDMWRLACSSVCQSCKKPDARGQPNLSDALRPGPGPNGVAIVWPFASRMCLSCLLKTSIKEVDLLLSPTIPNAILPALPFVLLGQDLVIVPGSTIESGQLPPENQVTRLYSASDVETLEKEFTTVKDMGSGTVDEWLKGLEGRGNDMCHEVSKWEKWEASCGLAKMCCQLYPGYEPLLIPALDQGLSASSAGASRSSASSTPNHPSLPNRPERTMEVVAELKAARKAEIERRGMRLEPPMTADVLRHIPAFRAATQIIAPLDENAWGLLRQRLLAQRAEAEQWERDGAAQTTDSKPENAERQLETTLATTKEARDLIDKEWEEIQAPVRAKISGYADEIIREKWDKGRRLSKDTCPNFATDVLIYIRKRFYDEVAKDAAAARAAGQSPVVDPPEGPFTQKLTLENMKWIFDTKIKPHTESYRKELFFCNGCEGNYKTFGFEGVVQHYAAKHTSSLSVGSIVVHWRAEWPEHPPFASEGRPVKQPLAFFSQGPGPGSLSVPFPHSTPLPPTAYHYQPPLPPPVYPPSSGSGPGPGSGYAVPPYGEHYAQPPPPQPYPPQPTYGPPAPFVLPGGYGSLQPYAPPPSPYPPYQPPTAPYPPPPIGVDPASSYAPPPSGNYMYPYGSHQANAPPVYSAPVPPPAPYPDTYQTKLEDIARNSREIWHALGSVKDLPGSARVFATIYHLVKRYRARFYETPPLAMFIDGLSNNKDMRPVRNVNGLVCKTCHLGLGNAASVEQDRKNFSLPQLANHFQSKHIEPMQHMNPQLDWIVDMLLLPDPATISDILPSAGESQRAMLSDAFLEALLSRPAVADQPPYEGQYGHSEAYPAHSGVDNAAFYGHQPPTERGHNQPNESGYHANRQPMEGYSSGAYLAPAQIGRPEGPPVEHHATRSGYLEDRSQDKLEIDRPAQNTGGRRSPQGPQQSRHENGSQTNKKKGGRNKRGKPQNRSESSHRLLEEDVKRDENEARREEEEIRAMWAADRAGAARAYTSTKLPVDEQETKDKPHATQTAATAQQTRNHTPLKAQLSQQDVAQLVAARPEGGVLNIMAALESHLDQGPSLGTPNHQPAPSDGMYLDTRSSGAVGDSRSASRTYGRYSDGGNRPRSPASYGSRYHQPALVPQVRERSPPPPQLEQQPEPAYYSRPIPPAERNEASYDRYRARSEYPEQRLRHPDDRRYQVPPRRPDEYGHEQAPRPEYPHYPEDGPPPSLGPVELFEIVHVIDEHGEYYIRRPVRREAEPPRYIYEEGGRRAYQEADPYAGYEPVRAPAPRPNRLEFQRAEIRADTAYQEEYDPRYPGV